MNLYGLVRRWYERPSMPSVSLAEFLDFSMTRIPILRDWRVRFGMRSTSQWYFEGLRQLAGEAMGVRVWMELGFGRSYRCFRGLDLYLKPHLFGAPYIEEVAWYVLYQDCRNMLDRMEPAPEDFRMLTGMVSMGQFQMLGDWQVELPGGVVTHPLQVYRLPMNNKSLSMAFW